MLNTQFFLEVFHMNKSTNFRDTFFYRFLGMENKNHVNKLTLANLEQEMENEEFPKVLIKEIVAHFNMMINEKGDEKFKHWIFNLHFQILEPFKNELKAENIYNKYEDWIEREIVKLENETDLSWQEQSADLEKVNLKARKAQLVLRHRMTEVVLNVLDKHR